MKLKNLTKKAAFGLSLIALLTGAIKDSYSQSAEPSEDSGLVICGESNHDSKKQKNFMINSIDSLRNKGYNYFAIELSVKNDSSIQRYLISDKSYQDDTIKRLLESENTRGALEVAYNFYKNGFKVIPIDQGEEINFYSGWNRINDTLVEINNERDFYMAKNIEAIFEKDSSAKIFCYVGGFHANETQDILKLKKRGTSIYIHKHLPMAGILKKKGIDPTTICLVDKNTEYVNRVKDPHNLFDKKIYLE